MKYFKATLAAWRRTGMNTVNYMMNLFSLIAVVLIITAAFSGDNEGHAVAIIGILLLGMTVMYSHTELTSRYCLFYGERKFESNPFLFNLKPEKMLQVMPFSREEAMHSYVNIVRFYEFLVMLPMIVFGVKAVMQSFSTTIIIAGSALFIFLTVSLTVYEKVLLTYNGKKISNAHQYGTFYGLIMLFYTMNEESFVNSKFNMPVLSIIFGAITLIAAVVCFVVLNKYQKQLISDCKTRSFSGEPIGGAK
ncbi:MAG: hypothetical protein ACI4I1_06050 [Oscillospiraceae bacterium]